MRSMQYSHRTPTASWQAPPLRDKFASPTALVIYLVILTGGPILMCQSLEYRRSVHADNVFMLSSMAVFFSFLMLIRFSRYHDKYKYLRSYRMGQEGITIIYAERKEEYRWHQVAGWEGNIPEDISFDDATPDHRAIAKSGKDHLVPDDGVTIKLANGSWLNLEVPSDRVDEVMEILNRHKPLEP